MGDVPIHYMSLRDVARLIEAGELSPVALTEAMLDRIDAVDGRLRSYATVMADEALAAARAAESEIGAGRYRGPLHGVPIAVKDLCYTKGVRTMGALPVLADFVPDFDATVVERLHAAGAVLLGKLNLTEGAMGAYHPDFDIPVNPWDEGLWDGRFVERFGRGDGGGPLFRLARLGHRRIDPLSVGPVRHRRSQADLGTGSAATACSNSRASLDHIGPMTRTVADAAIMLEAIAGADANDPTALDAPVPSILPALDGDIAGMRLGFDRRYATEGVDPAVAAAVEEALRVLAGLGAEVTEVEMPAAPFGDWWPLCSYEAVRAHAATYPSRAAEYGPYFGRVPGLRLGGERRGVRRGDRTARGVQRALRGDAVDGRRARLPVQRRRAADDGGDGLRTRSGRSRGPWSRSPRPSIRRSAASSSSPCPPTSPARRRSPCPAASRPRARPTACSSSAAT